MPIISGFKKRIRYLKSGMFTYKELLAACLDRGLLALCGRSTRFFAHVRAKRISEGKGLPPAKCSDGYHIRDIRIPLLDARNEYAFYSFLWEETFSSYMFNDDKYDEASFNKYDQILEGGFYGLFNDKVSVTVEPGDIVIDAGSWVGDFAAYASVKGASVYAFEPADDLYGYLTETARMNRNIFPVKKGISSESTNTTFYTSPIGESEANSLIALDGYIASQIEVTTIDDFVRENHLPRVDFIKADIEGFERHMLAGAQETLARFAPKLALCTYHLPDDPEVMAKLIIQANPKYNIVQKRKKLFASVPE